MDARALVEFWGTNEQRPPDISLQYPQGLGQGNHFYSLKRDLKGSETQT